MSKRYIQLMQIELWKGFGSGYCFRATLGESLEHLLVNQIEEARRIKQERLRDRDVRFVIKSLSERGLEIVDPLIGYDRNDLVGLTGEVVVEDFVSDLGIEPILPKWRYSGSSKSKGIDLVARRKTGDTWGLVLCEAKHVHEEVRNKRADVCHNSIRNRFRIGIDEFELERTRFNLARIIMKLGDTLRLAEAVGSDVSLIREHLKLVLEGLRDDDYIIRVVALVDDTYCSYDTFRKSVANIPRPLNAGDHHLDLTLLESANIEEVTDRMCDIFVGSF